ncbi:hypothetical protein DRN93_01215 [archaeon]|nr:MAG: hypothetical protein DRN93_01215 [archaeon]
MATIDGTKNASAGVPFEGSLQKFFILENILDFDSLDPASGDTVKALPVEGGMRVFGTEVEIVTPSDAATSASATVGDGDDPDGFDTNVDLKGSAGTVVGTSLALSEGTPNTLVDAYAGVGKRYTDDDTIDVTVTYNGTTTVKGKIKIRAWGVKMD